MSDYEVVLKKIDPIQVIAIRDTLPGFDSFGKLLGELFGELGGMGIAPAGPPIALYYDQEHKESDVDVEVAAPIGGEVPQLSGRARQRELPAEGKMASLMHCGSYEDFNQAYKALMAWVDANDYQMSGPIREIYLRGPESGSDPSEYMTEIQMPVAER